MPIDHKLNNKEKLESLVQRHQTSTLYMKTTTTFNLWNGYDNQKLMVGPPSSANFVDRGKNPLQQKGSLSILQVPIRLTNVWYGRLDGIMDPLPF